MRAIRIIPRLDIKGPNLVKGIHLEGLRVLGEPESFASHYYNNMADELILMDVVASLYGRNSLHEIISKTAQEIFIPITVGGGLRSIEDIKDILRSGADKISINTAALERPELIREASLSFGSSTIVSSIECIKHEDNNYYAYSDNGREFSGKNVFEWVEELEYLGAGEINICSVDKEGTRSGYDIELIKKINVKGMAHITGGGLTENIPRILKKGLIADVQLSSWKFPKAFLWLQEKGKISTEDMLRIFNCGIGMVCILDQKEVSKAQKILSSYKLRSFEIGSITKGNLEGRIQYN